MEALPQYDKEQVEPWRFLPLPLFKNTRMGRDPAAIFGSQDYWYLEKKVCVCWGRKDSITYSTSGLVQWLSSKRCSCSAGDMGSIPESGRSPGGGHGNSLQHSCLENAIDRGAWWATVHTVTKSQTWLKWLSTHEHARILHLILKPSFILN